jgi:hypothetical protein
MHHSVPAVLAGEYFNALDLVCHVRPSFWGETPVLVAETAGAKEIRVEHLRAALESPWGESPRAETRPEIPEILLPVAHRDMML